MDKRAFWRAIMNQYPLTVCCQRLNISLFTLRQWCAQADINLEQQRSKADPRQKWLTDQQLQQLAEEHGRILDQPAQPPEPIPPAAYKLLIEQAAQAQHQAAQIRTDHATLQKQAQQINASLDTIRQEQAALHKRVEELGE